MITLRKGDIRISGEWRGDLGHSVYKAARGNKEGVGKTIPEAIERLELAERQPKQEMSQ
jgi:hypothetical protein